MYKAYRISIFKDQQRKWNIEKGKKIHLFDFRSFLARHLINLGFYILGDYGWELSRKYVYPNEDRKKDIKRDKKQRKLEESIKKKYLEDEKEDFCKWFRSNRTIESLLLSVKSLRHICKNCRGFDCSEDPVKIPNCNQEFYKKNKR